MPTDQNIAAPALLARIEVASPWAPPSWRATTQRRWLAHLAAAWREGMELCIRAGVHRGGYWGWF